MGPLTQMFQVPQQMPQMPQGFAWGGLMRKGIAAPQGHTGGLPQWPMGTNPMTPMPRGSGLAELLANRRGPAPALAMPTMPQPRAPMSGGMMSGVR